MSGATFIYKYECKACGKHFKERRNKQLKKVHEKKLCEECKEKESSGRTQRVFDDVVDCGGINQKESCKNCKHFGSKEDPDANRFWKRCGAGHEYATHDPDYQGAASVPLVYESDWCPDWEPKEEGINE